MRNVCDVGRKGRALVSIFVGELAARSQTDSWMSKDSEIAGEIGGRARRGRGREEWKAGTKTIVRLSHFFGLQGSLETMEGQAKSCGTRLWRKTLVGRTKLWLSFQ